MSTNFQIKALPREAFVHLMQHDDKLPADCTWLAVDAHPGYPCRASLIDALPGERVLALAWTHHDSDSPYRASGPIFVREHAQTHHPEINEIPAMLRHRYLSLRAYDTRGYMIEAGTAHGPDLIDEIQRMFANDRIDYLHIHNAKPGLFQLLPSIGPEKSRATFGKNGCRLKGCCLSWFPFLVSLERVRTRIESGPASCLIGTTAATIFQGRETR